MSSVGVRELLPNLNGVVAFSYAPQRQRKLNANAICIGFALETHCISIAKSSPRRSQLEPGLIERGTFRLKRLQRAAVIEIIPWNGSSAPGSQVPPLPSEPRDPFKLARYYQSLLDSGQFENRAALAR